MRVTQRNIWDSNKYQLGIVTEDLATASLTVSSGKQINSIKDDPVGVSQVLNLKSKLSDLDQVKRNLATGRTWLTAGETALGQARDMITQSKEVCLQMNDSTADAAQRNNAAIIIHGIIINILSLANTDVYGQYLFSGTNTDTAPFTLDSDTNPTAASYSGNDNAFAIRTGKNATIEVGQDGDAVFSDLFDTLIDLKGYLESNDISGIGSSIGRLDANFNVMIDEISEIGLKDLRIDIRENVIADLDLRYTANQAEIEDADMIEAITDLKTKQLAYEAALASSAEVMRLSLVDYL